jgi:lysophospholipase L1-like esterase
VDHDAPMLAGAHLTALIGHSGLVSGTSMRAHMALRAMARTRPAGRVPATRGLLRLAAYGGGGIGLLTGATLAVLVTEAKLARKWIGEPKTDPPVSDGLYGHHSGEPVRFVVVGDSSAAGLGVHDPHETPGALLAAGMSSLAERPVRMVNVARTGAQSEDLERQVDLALRENPEVALIMIGANDVTHRVRVSQSVRYLTRAVHRLRAIDCAVVVGTCPDLGTIEPVGQPLRWVARRWSRQLAAAQTVAVVEAGARSVSLGDLLGPEFAARPREMFGPDRFHPSAAGYASAAMALLPSLGAAMGFWPEESPSMVRGEGVLPVELAAAEAAEEAGTEVAATQVADRGARDRFALLRHRRRRPLPEVEETTEADLAGDTLLRERVDDDLADEEFREEAAGRR